MKMNNAEKSAKCLILCFSSSVVLLNKISSSRFREGLNVSHATIRWSLNEEIISREAQKKPSRRQVAKLLSYLLSVCSLFEAVSETHKQIGVKNVLIKLNSAFLHSRGCWWAWDIFGSHIASPKREGEKIKHFINPRLFRCSIESQSRNVVVEIWKAIRILHCV